MLRICMFVLSSTKSCVHESKQKLNDGIMLVFIQNRYIDASFHLLRRKLSPYIRLSAARSSCVRSDVVVSELNETHNQ